MSAGSSSTRSGTASVRARTHDHSLPVLVALHLVPGIVTAALFYLLGPLVVRSGYPPIAAGSSPASSG